MCYFIIVQVGAVALYTLLALEVLLRYKLDRPVRPPVFVEKADEGPLKHRGMDRGIKFMLIGLAISTVFILVRSIYRTIELLDGWTGRIITTQLYFVSSLSWCQDLLLTLLPRMCLTGVRLSSPCTPSTSSTPASSFVTAQKHWVASQSLP